MPKLPEWVGDLVNMLTLFGMIWTAGVFLWKLSAKMLRRERQAVRFEPVPQRVNPVPAVGRRVVRRRVGLWESVTQEVRRWWLYKVMLVDKSPAQHLGIVLGMMLGIGLIFFINSSRPASPVLFPGLIGVFVEWVPTVAIGVLSLLLMASVARLLFVLNYEGEAEGHEE